MNVIPAGTLSEQEIKAITLRLLKKYYRNRLRAGEVEVTADVRGKGGIVADGFLYYPRPGGTQFVATFEATSFDSRMEARYTQRRNLLLWDNLVFALWGTAIGGMFNFARQLVPIKIYGPLLPWVMFATVFTVLFFAYRILFSNRVRYRKIYAIEQFKQYYSDEQWISVGQDVFRDVLDPHFIELRRQCIRFGIGLIVVDKEGRPHIHLTPSREDVFEGRREVVQLLTGKQFAQRVQTLADRDWLRRFQGRLRGVLDPQNPEWINRFQRYRPKHWIAAAAAVMLITAIWYREYDAWLHRKVPHKVYAEEVSRQARSFPKDPPGYRLDTPYYWPEPFLDDRISYLDEWLEDRLAQGNARRNAQRNTIAVEEGLGLIYYDCARFRNFDGVKFILLDAVYPDFESAALRVEQLQYQGVQGGSLWLGCFHSSSREFAVFFGPIFNTPQEALRVAENLEYLRSDRSTEEFLTVKAITNQVRNLPPRRNPSR